MKKYLCIGGGNNHNWESSGPIKVGEDVTGRIKIDADITVIVYTCKDCGLKGTQTYYYRRELLK